jgi:hypothetical protein
MPTPILPKELKNKKVKIHQTTPMGHAGSAEPGDSSKESDKEEDGMIKRDSFLKHPQVRSKAISQHKLINDTAYFLHHPQIKPHGPSMPPKKPKG